MFGWLCFILEIRLERVVIEGSLNVDIRWIDGISIEGFFTCGDDLWQWMVKPMVEGRYHVVSYNIKS